MKNLIFVILLFVFIIGFQSLKAQTWNSFNTSYGYINLGPANSSWAHIYSDRPNFLFNKDLYSISGGYSSYSTSNLFLKTNGITRMIINNSNGNVGIGNFNPLYKLHVLGESKIEGGLIVSHNVNYDWGYGFSISVNRDKTKAISINRSDTGTNMFTVYGNGVVNAKKIYAEEIEVRVDAMNISWPDYVFKNKFELLPLCKLEQYIKINGCLPDVPSEFEIYKNGINLVEMDAILLKKIEELTLYILKQEKQIELLKKNK